jgi:uncharacterized membrane protein
MVVALVNALLGDMRETAPLIYAVVMFLANVAVGWVALEIARSYSRKERQRVEGVRQVVEAQH